MIRRLLFSCLLVPSALALLVAPSLSAPVIGQVGSAHVTVRLSPDPPQLGFNTVTVVITDVSASVLVQTSLHYSTVMPSMHMAGPSGTAVRAPGRAGQWRFNVRYGMASPWIMHLQFRGALTGTIDTNLAVSQPIRPMPSSARTQRAAMGGGPADYSTDSMASMSANSGNANAWRNATFALIAVILVGALVLPRDRRPATIGMVVIAALVIVGIAYAQSRYASGSLGMTSMDARGAGPIPVTLARIGRDPGVTTISAPANVMPYLIQNIIARAPGVITNFSAYTGDRLHAGQVVATLNEPELQNNAQAAQAAAQAAQSQRLSAQEDAVSMRAGLSAARANVRYWNAEISRERQLLNEGAVSLQEFQNERAQAASARSADNVARAKLAAATAATQGAQAQVAQAAANAQAQDVLAGYTRVVAPDDAVVTKRYVDPGVYVQVGTPILQVAVIARLRVQAQISQQNLSAVQVGTPMDVFFEDGKTLHGRVSSVSPVVDPTTHTAIAEAIVQNTKGEYQPGGFVHVVLHVQGAVRRDSFSVPSGAVVGGATTAVWTDLNGAAHRVPVTVLSDDGTTAQISGGLPPGSRVVVTGAANLEEGQAIAASAP